MKKIVSLVAAAAITLGISNVAFAKDGFNVSRLYGADRYKTSISISNNFNSGTVQNVIIASGKDFPDALAGSVLSKKLNAPIVLSGGTVNDSADSIQYIKDHLDKNGTIYLLGGTASISNEFVDYMKNQGYNNFVRLGGKDRFDTNKYIVNSMNVEKGTPVVIANAYGFADALSVSSIAAQKGYPIIMTSTSSLSDEAKDMIKNIEPSQVYIIGGYASVGDNVVNQIKGMLPSLSNDKIIKLAGQDRYETSLSVCKHFNLDTDTAVIANGENFPDALSGSALASKLNAPIVLVDGQDVTKQKDFIYGGNFKNIVLLGGYGSVDFPVEYLLKGSAYITQEERDYVNKLTEYCDGYKTESTKAESYFQDVMNKVTSEDMLSGFENPDTMMSTLDKFIELYKGCSSAMDTYKQNLVSLRDKASSLQAPNGIEALKQSYINNINLDIQSADKASALLNSYVNAFSSFRDAVNSGDESKIEEAVKNLQSVGSSSLEELNSLKGGDQGINALKEKLVKIKSNMD